MHNHENVKLSANVATHTTENPLTSQSGLVDVSALNAWFNDYNTWWVEL